MARVSSFTIFVWVTLVVYTLISAGLVSVINASSYQNPYNTSTLPEGSNYVYSETHNITYNGGNFVYSSFIPDRRINWRWALADEFLVQRPDEWLGWFWYTLTGCPTDQNTIIADWSNTTGYSFYKLDAGSPYQTDMFCYPLLNSTGRIYDNMTQSVANNIMTVLLGSNLTATTMFDISALTGIATGYSGQGAPIEIAAIIGGIWWILLLLGLVKLVTG